MESVNCPKHKISPKQYASYETRITSLSEVLPEERMEGLLKLGEDGYYKGYNLAGITCFNNKEYEKANELYKKALELDPDNAFILNNIGELLQEEESPYFNKEEAISYFKRSKCSLAYKNLGHLYSESNKELAIKYFKKAIKKGASKECFYEIGKIYATEENCLVLAAAYFYLGLRYRNEKSMSNYVCFRKLVHKKYGGLWVHHIESLGSMDEIDTMISTVNALKRAKVVLKCPKCGSYFTRNEAGNTEVECLSCGYKQWLVVHK